VRTGQLIVHTSGRHGVSVLEPVLRAGALPLALHPAMSFTGTEQDVARVAGCSFGVTAPEPLRPIAEALVVEMGGEPEWVTEADRPLYHAALALGSNYLTTLIAQAGELLRQAGVSHPDRSLGPLLSATLDNSLRELGQGRPDQALTGPVVRGDAGTVEAHLRALGDAASSASARAMYLAMARLTADRALAAGRLAAERAEPPLDVLAARPGAAEPRADHGHDGREGRAGREGRDDAADDENGGDDT
jgi:predicted short-subunit dehydrogenase-like oxidoreductase (DUF2520 family)